MVRHHLHPLSSIFAAASLAVAFVASPAGAQTAPNPAAQAQLLYERELASCNTGALATPEREACVRAAGLRYDRARGVPPAEDTVTTPDGRATVVTPSGANAPSNLPETETSRDGRATIVR